MNTRFLILSCIIIVSCAPPSTKEFAPTDPSLEYLPYKPTGAEFVVSRAEYEDKLYGFWLGQCIANWTGLVTEMDKIGSIGDIRTGDFYTREDWGKPDQPNIWSEGESSPLSPTIDFVFEDSSGVWGADDDTDIEYMYQHLLFENQTSLLTGEQIRDGWLNHIHEEEENYLWVSNQTAFDLMGEGTTPPETSNPDLNPHYEMIDAQLTTEIFGLFSPARPDFAREMATLPIQTTAREEAEWISMFYVNMYAQAIHIDSINQIKQKLFRNAEYAKSAFPEDSYPAKMYDFVKSRYEAGIPWEQTRDEIYQRYQVEEQDGYDITSQNLYCNGCFAAGINFAASLVSLFYGEGDLIETIKIGALAGWDSDNPTATWGGMLGFIYGKEEIERAFNREFSQTFYIHRTRKGFPNDGYDSFSNMARKGLFITDRVIQEDLGGGVDLEKNVWYIPVSN
ncbi:MAG: ADP-ribosylglycohydrolase family protein [Balneola sp.]|nr:MAG: ADP-ribosylglycohydrolase family protein [Balneola sp.]